MSGDINDCTITVAAEAGRGWSSHMMERFRQTPTLLKPSANNSSCCIFKVPKSQVEKEPKAYEPCIVSVGPYHHGKEHLKMIEEHKPRLFSALLDRTRDYGAGLDRYLEDFALLETRIRDSYSEALNYETLDLIEMMILDACFLVEMFRITASVIKPDEYGPLFAMPRIISSVTIDLLQIENQIPFFVLQKIYDLSKSPFEPDCSLKKIALGFFKNAPRLPEEELPTHDQVSNAMHLLDLLRLSMVGHLNLQNLQAVDEELQPMPSTQKLLLEGIDFRPSKRKNPTNVEFNNGVLSIPPLTIDSFTTCFFFNCVAFEQCCCYCSKHITTYVIAMRCLVSTAEDVKFLSGCSIITNLLGSDEDVTIFFHNLSKDVLFDIRLNYLAELFRQVTQYRNRPSSIWKGQMKHVYFSKPWIIISLSSSFVTLMLSAVQATVALCALYPSKK